MYTPLTIIVLFTHIHVHTFNDYCVVSIKQRAVVRDS